MQQTALLLPRNQRTLLAPRAAAAAAAARGEAPLHAHSIWVARAPAAAGPAASQEATLLSLPAAVSNWEQATAALPGAAWTVGTDPCGGGGGQPWRGVTCSGPNVTALQLAALGLMGTLPAALSALPHLVLLDLSDNDLRSSIPAAWVTPGTAFPALEDINLSDNELTGGGSCCCCTE